MPDEDLRQLERAWREDRGDRAVLERLIEARLRLGMPVPGEEREARFLPPRAFDSRLTLHVQALAPGGSKPLGIGKTPAGAGGLAIPGHATWWVIPAPPGKCDLDALRDEIAARGIPGVSFEKKKIDGRGLAKLAGLGLSTLLLKECRRVTDAGLEHVATLRNLAWLDLTRTGVTDAGLVHLAALPHLFSLKLWKDYSCPPLTRVAAGHLARCTNLMRLDIAGCPLGREGLEQLGGLTELRELGLMDCELTDADLVALGRLEKLEVLDVTGNTLGDAALGHLAGASRLRRLRIMGSITAEGLRRLAPIPALTDLDLPGGVTITDESLEALAAFPALERVDFGACPFALERGLASLPERRFDLCYDPPSPAFFAALEGLLDARVLPRPKTRAR